MMVISVDLHYQNTVEEGKLCASVVQYFLEEETPFAAIVAPSLVGYISRSFAHLGLGSLSHSSWQILSNSVRLHEKRL